MLMSTIDSSLERLFDLNDPLEQEINRLIEELTLDALIEILSKGTDG